MDIKLYTINTCKWCNELRTWLKRKRLSFQEIDLMDSKTARDVILENTNKFVTPVIEINGKFIVGFHKEDIEAALST